MLILFFWFSVALFTVKLSFPEDKCSENAHYYCHYYSVKGKKAIRQATKSYGYTKYRVSFINE